jgi:nicotinamidase-related amidase
MDLIYKEKYLKYKLKYNNLKKQYGSSVNNYRVLIVVDLQNCFLEHFGTLGWQPFKSKKNREDIIRRYKEKIKKLINSNAYDIIVFTKDSHPFGHASFNTELGMYAPHCVDEKKICKDYKKNEESYKKNEESYKKDTIEKFKGKNIIDELETSVRYDIKLYINDINLKNEKVPITTNNIMYHIPSQNDNPISVLTKDKLNELKNNKNKLIVRLNKGELCKNDAYSGFLYHTYYDKIGNEKDILEEIDHTYSDYSTGLYELLNTYYKNLDKLTIDVCGLVTNICVVNTCIGALKIFRENHKTVKINLLNEYSLNLHIPTIDAIDKMKKCHFKENTDYEIINDESKSKNYNKIYFINKPAEDGFYYK